MQVPLTSLLAAAIHQCRFEFADPDALAMTLDFVAATAGGQAVQLEAGDAELLVNAVALPLDAPGASIVHRALTGHQVMRLRLPPGTTATQWRVVVELLASAPGLYESVDDLRDALRAELPDVMVANTRGRAAEADLRGALFELPGLRGVSSSLTPVRAVDPHDAELAAIESRLDPLLQVAASARDEGEYETLAQVLLQIRELEEDSNAELRALVARERRRIISTEVLEGMARTISRPTTSANVGRALGALGTDGADALISALSGAPGPQERRAFIDALVACRECDDAVLGALGNARLELARDAAEVAGRKRLERAVPMLTHMLKHPRADIRTAAWHALELIGTPAAMKAFRT